MEVATWRPEQGGDQASALKLIGGARSKTVLRVGNAVLDVRYTRARMWPVAIIATFLLQSTQSANTQCAWILWRQQSASEELPSSLSGWEFYEAHADLKSCMASAPPRLAATVKRLANQGYKLVPVKAKPISTLVAGLRNEESKHQFFLQYVCYPATFDPRK
jgi:hypothetical protein